MARPVHAWKDDICLSYLLARCRSSSCTADLVYRGPRVPRLRVSGCVLLDTGLWLCVVRYGSLAVCC